MHLYLANLGYQKDSEFIKTEQHEFLFLVAPSLNSAKKQLKVLPEFKRLKMHIDSLIEVERVGEYNVQIVPPAP